MEIKSPNSDKHVCMYCENGYSHLSSLCRHKKQCPMKVALEKAKEYQKQFEDGLIDKDEFEKNLIVLRSDKYITAKNCLFSCEHCRKSFSRKSSLRRHYKYKKCKGSAKEVEKKREPDDDMYYKCHNCFLRFSNENTLLLHEQKGPCRSIEEYYSLKDGTYSCRNCQTEFQKVEAAWHHVKVCNPMWVAKMYKNHCEVKGCNFKCRLLSQLMRHMNTFHSANILSKTKVFDSMQSFFKWKVKEERKNFIFFKKSSSYVKGKNKKVYYFNCHFRKSKTDFKRKTSRRLGNAIVDHRCLANIKVTETENQITATYFNKHSHSLTFDNVKQQRWLPETRRRIIKLLRLGYSPKEIKESLKSYVSEVGNGVPLKEHYITTKQILRFKNRLFSSKHLDTNLVISAQSEQSENHNVMLINKPEADDVEILQNDEESTMIHENVDTDNQPIIEIVIPFNSEDKSPDQDDWNEEVQSCSFAPVDIRSSCKSLLKTLDHLLSIADDKINCLLPQMYDSLKQLIDEATVVIENNIENRIADVGSKDRLDRVEDYTISIDSDEGNIQGQTRTTGPASSEKLDILQESLLDIGMTTSDEAEGESNENEIKILSVVSPENVIIDGYDFLDVENASYEEAAYQKEINTNNFTSSENNEDLNKPFLKVGPHEINHVELKSLDLSITDDEVTSIKTFHNHSFEKGLLFDVIVDSFLYILCLNQNNYELIESWKAKMIVHEDTEGIDLQKKEIILIPYNPDRQWMLIVIHTPKRKLYILDALNVNFIKEHFEVARKIIMFLNMKLNLDDNTSWIVTSPERCTHKEDINSGVYLCYYAMRFMSGQRLTESCNVEEFRKIICTILKEWGKKKL